MGFSEVLIPAYKHAGRSSRSWVNSIAFGEPIIARSLTKTTTQQERQSAARTFAIDAAALAAGLRCKDVVVLDVAGLSPVCDYFVIATGSSGRQMRSVADDVIALAGERNFAPINHQGLDSEHWMLADCVDVIVHIFNEQSRSYYDLDNLWGDARPVDWNAKQ